MTTVNSWTAERDGQEYRVDVKVDDAPLNPRDEFTTTTRRASW